MSVSDRVRDLVAPICTDLGLEIYDVEHAAGKVRVTVDRPGGVDLEALAVATRLISRELDERDPVPGRYQLEVVQPRPRAPAAHPGPLPAGGRPDREHPPAPSAGDVRRIAGVLTEADDDGVTVRRHEGATARPSASRSADIERARTTFAWGGQPKPGKGPRAVRTPAAPEAEETA